METPNDPKPSIAFFGATGGCAASALALSLKNGYHCSARNPPSPLFLPSLTLLKIVARTPSKLTTLLLSKGVLPSTLSTHLTTTHGDVLSASAVRNVLSPSERVVDTIISGIGMVNLLKDNTICTDATRTILTALAELQPATKPLFLVISTTGITAGPRDVPLLLGPLYHVLLAKPHNDKRNMEKLVTSQLTPPSSTTGTDEKPSPTSGAVISDYIIVRPTLLANGPSLYDEGKVRVGSEGEPVVGYTISREDVGRWVFEVAVRGGGEAWRGERVSLCY